MLPKMDPHPLEKVVNKETNGTSSSPPTPSSTPTGDAAKKQPLPVEKKPIAVTAAPAVKTAPAAPPAAVIAAPAPAEPKEESAAKEDVKAAQCVE